MMAWLIVGFAKWGNIHVLSRYKKMMVLWGILMVGMILSFIPLDIHYDQPPIYSLWLYRDFLMVFIVIPVLLCMRLRKKDIFHGLWLFSIVYVIFWGLAFFMPVAFKCLEGEVASSADAELLIPGIEYLTIPLYIQLENYSKQSSFKELAKILFLLLVIFLVQNRSTLFVAAAFTAIGLWRGKSVVVKILITVVFVAFLMTPQLNPLYSLVEETKSEVGDSTYNRILAWDYFLKNDFDSLEHILCGRGEVSSYYGSQNNQMLMLAEYGIHPSDVGFLGFMYYFGIVPVIIFVVTSIIGIIKGFHHLTALLMFGIHVLVCGTTISYFVGYEHGLWFSLLVILLCVSSSSKKKRLIIVPKSI